MDSFRLKAGYGIGAVSVAVEAVEVARSRSNAVKSYREVAVLVARHRLETFFGRDEMEIDPVTERSPDQEPATSPVEDGRPEQVLLVVQNQLSFVKNSAPSGGRVRTREYGRPFHETGVASTPPRLP